MPSLDRHAWRPLASLALVLGLLSACDTPQAEPAQAVPTDSPAARGEVLAIDAEQSVALIRAGASVLDVRSPAEWRQGHLREALHVPVGEIPATPLEQLPEKDQTVVVYCAAGGRASQAGVLLAERGFEKVYVLKPGGYEDLAQAGLPVASGP